MLSSNRPNEIRRQSNEAGHSDAQAAAAAARREGFPAHTVIFLDQEQGGRMLPEQKAYIYSWVDGITAAGFRAGIYCSGIPSPDDENVVTAEDIRAHAGEGARATREIVYWAINDACPPAPGCVFPSRPPSPAESGVGFAEVWQFRAIASAQRRRRALRQRQPGWRMLSARNFAGTATSCGLELRNQPRPFTGKNTLIACGAIC